MHFDIRKDTEQTSKTIFTCAYLIYHKDVRIRLKTVQSKILNVVLWKYISHGNMNYFTLSLSRNPPQLCTWLKNSHEQKNENTCMNHQSVKI